jgi:hypothetical protein
MEAACAQVGSAIARVEGQVVVFRLTLAARHFCACGPASRDPRRLTSHALAAPGCSPAMFPSRSYTDFLDAIANLSLPITGVAVRFRDAKGCG